MTCKGCNRAVYDSDVDRNGLCCFCSPEGEALKGTGDFGEGTPVTTHGTETVASEPEDEPADPAVSRKRRRKAR